MIKFDINFDLEAKNKNFFLDDNSIHEESYKDEIKTIKDEITSWLEDLGFNVKKKAVQLQPQFITG